VLHLGYSRAEDRRAKADFYLRRNTGTNLHHARTILSPPALRPLAELLDVPDLLVAVPIRDRAWMVPALTGSLDRLAWPRERLRVVIQLNDSHDETGELLDRWVQGPGRGYAEIEETSLPHSVAGDHEWAGPPWDPDGPLKRMTQLRNRALELLRCTGAGALLSLDSDVILDPRTASHLHATGADIISPVFWAGWRQQRDEPPPRVELPEWLAERPDVRRIVAALRQGRLPQVWERGQYELSADLLLDLIARRGIHDVGGLGAATWIRREVAEAGLRYDPIPNLPSEMQGEDRHFCVRAACEGFRLRATSYLPAVHCDDAADLERVAPELEVPLRGTRWPTVWEPAGVPIEGEPRERTRRPEAETRRVQAARART
jgi:hypothetical protein